MRDVWRHADAISSAADRLQACEAFREATESLGYDCISYHRIYAGPEPGHVGPNETILDNCPPDWTEHYELQGYWEIDAASSFSYTSPVAFAVENLPQIKWHTRAQRRIVEERKEAGLRNSVCIPIHDWFGTTAAIRVASTDRLVDASADLRLLSVLGLVFHQSFTSLNGPDVHETPRLTARERECLSWCAFGKSAWDISMILGISHHGVRFHIKNAMKKLNAGSRINAVVKALRLGLISL